MISAKTMHPGGPSSNLTDVLMRRRNLGTERDTPEMGMNTGKARWGHSKPKERASEETCLPTPWSWTTSLQKIMWENKFLSCKPLCLWYFVMAAAANWYISLYSSSPQTLPWLPTALQVKAEVLTKIYRAFIIQPSCPFCYFTPLPVSLVHSVLATQPFHWSFKTAHFGLRAFYFLASLRRNPCPRYLHDSLLHLIQILTHPWPPCQKEQLFFPIFKALPSLDFLFFLVLITI